MAELNEAYVVGLLSDLETQVPAMERELAQARARAAAIDAELSALVRRLGDSKSGLEQAQADAQAATVRVTEHNLRIATLHQELAALRRRSEDLKTEMDRVGPGAIHRKLRRDRAKLTVQIEDRDAEVEKRRQEVDAARQAQEAAAAAALAERDRARLIVGELDKLQEMLPSPYLYTGLFGHLAARSHCRLFLDHDAATWRREVRRAVVLMGELHQALRAGKYRLDKNSDVVGGRAMATAEAVYAAVALGEDSLARELFELATDAGLFFHQIFNVFRVWCLGLYLTGRTRELKELCRLHQFATGLRGGYVQVFIGLITEERERVAHGLRAIVKHEWELWQDPSLVRGAGVVNLGAVALSRISSGRGLRPEALGPTVAAELLPVPAAPNRQPRQPARR